MITDPIADFLTRIRNAIKANHKTVSMPSSQMKKSIASVLLDKGYIKSFRTVEVEEKKSKHEHIEITLKYTPGFANREPAIVKLVRVSKPGLRKYYKSKEIPQIINGLGISILSTSKGVMSDKEARSQNLGGELLCYIY